MRFYKRLWSDWFSLFNFIGNKQTSRQDKYVNVRFPGRFAAFFFTEVVKFSLYILP